MKQYLVTARKFKPKFRNAFAATLSTGGPFSCVESVIREWTVEGTNEDHARANWNSAKAHGFKQVKGFELISIEQIVND